MKKLFTLIEIIIVIAILSLIVSLMIPIPYNIGVYNGNFAWN